MNYDVKDLDLAKKGKLRIEWAGRFDWNIEAKKMEAIAREIACSAEPEASG